MSGGEPSSIKRSTECAARKPVLSRKIEDRAEANFDLGVYGLVLQSGAAADIQRLPLRDRWIFIQADRRDKQMHQAFYRKWRPQIFDDVYGQEHITSVLRYEAEHGAFRSEEHTSELQSQ